MRRGRNLLLAAAGALLVLAGGCTTGLRDAVLAGTFDFVSGTTAQFLGSVLGTATG